MKKYIPRACSKLIIHLAPCLYVEPTYIQKPRKEAYQKNVRSFEFNFLTPVPGFQCGVVRVVWISFSVVVLRGNVLIPYRSLRRAICFHVFSQRIENVGEQMRTLPEFLENLGQSSLVFRQPRSRINSIFLTRAFRRILAVIDNSYILTSQSHL